MRVIHTTGLARREVTEFGSHGFGVVPTARRAHVVLVSLDRGGLIGRHPTVQDQLFLVLEGEALVSGEDGRERTVGPGSAALWVAGESHATQALSDLRAVVIEAEGLAARFGSEVEAHHHAP
jgi:quercetin dioxygenase-like cupin family protein